MVRQLLVQPVVDEPTDGDVDLSFAHQPAVVHDASEETGEHQAHGHLGIDAGTTVVRAIAVGHLCAQPRQIEHAIDSHQRVVIRNELSERASDEDLQLAPLLAPKHVPAPPPIANHRPEANPTAQTFSTTPRGSAATLPRAPWPRPSSAPRGYRR